MSDLGGSSGYPGHTGTPPNAAHLALIKEWTNGEKKELEKKIMNAFAQDGIIQDPSNMSVTFKNAKKKEVHLIGKVRDATWRDRAIEIVKNNAGDDIKIIDELTIKNV